MPGHVFVDESKDRDYLLVAAVVLQTDLGEVRRSMRELVLPGQRRVHMKKENDRRKRVVAAAVATSGIRASVYRVRRGYRSELDARAACLDALIFDAVAGDCEVVVLERDDSLLVWERRHLYATTRRIDPARPLRYEHQAPASEPLLWIPDAVAWCVAKGGDWRRRIDPVVASVRDL